MQEVVQENILAVPEGVLLQKLCEIAAPVAAQVDQYEAKVATLEAELQTMYVNLATGGQRLREAKTWYETFGAGGPTEKIEKCEAAVAALEATAKTKAEEIAILKKLINQAVSPTAVKLQRTASKLADDLVIEASKASKDFSKSIEIFVDSIMPIVQVVGTEMAAQSFSGAVASELSNSICTEIRKRQWYAPVAARVQALRSIGNSGYRSGLKGYTENPSAYVKSLVNIPISASGV